MEEKKPKFYDNWPKWVKFAVVGFVALFVMVAVSKSLGG